MKLSLPALFACCALSFGCQAGAFDVEASATPDLRAGDFVDVAASAGITDSAKTLDRIPALGFIFKRAQPPEESSTPGAPPAKRLMIYSAELRLEVSRVADAITACRAIAERLGGYLEARATSTLTLRVPADRFEEFLASTRELGRVLDESMQAADVTKQHRDTTIRLENARKARERLLALLESAKEVDDILKIEKELQRLTTEIESAVAALESLDQRIALSSVAVTFNARITPDRPGRARKPSQFGWINSIGVDEVLQWF